MDGGHGTRAHARFGGSTIGRTIACPGWAQQAGDTESPSSSYAQEGTRAHELAERCLASGIEPEDMIDRSLQPGGEPVTAEMAEAVAVYVRYVRSRLQEGDVLLIEQRVSLAALNPPEEMYGTADAAILSAARSLLEVVDYKHGAGVFVPATTPQLRYYGAGALLSLPDGMPVPDVVRATVVQPRAYSDEGPVRWVEMPTWELVDWAWGLVEVIERALAPNPPLNPGSHCRFCPAAAGCPALRREAEDVVGSLMFPAEGPPPPVIVEEGEDDRLARLLEKIPLIETWIGAVKARAREVLGSGASLPGWKLVDRKGHRAWADEGAALAALELEGLDRDQLETRKVVSPAKALKQIAPRRRAALERYLTESGVLVRRPSEPILARSEDSRPAVEDRCATPSLLSIFEDL